MSKIDDAVRLRKQGMTCLQVGKVLGMSDSWVHKWTPHAGKPWHRWTEDEVITLRKMIACGKRVNTIAQKLGRSRQSVILKWHRLPHHKKTRDERMRESIETLLYEMRAIKLGCPPKRAVQVVQKADVVGRYCGS